MKKSKRQALKRKIKKENPDLSGPARGELYQKLKRQIHAQSRARAAAHRIKILSRRLNENKALKAKLKKDFPHLSQTQVLEVFSLLERQRRRLKPLNAEDLRRRRIKLAEQEIKESRLKDA